tara:strand:+ start:526 stop:1278 length:753 start_codon:yes stop_codon:yes gene_type:complete
VADPAAPQEWFTALPEELQADKSLANFSSKPIAELAKGYLETKRVATSKVTLPKEDDPESFDRFAAAVRPEDPASYTIDVPEGDGTDFADHMRGVFHEAGLHPLQVNKVVAANNAFVQQMKQAESEKGQAEMDALEAEMGSSEFARGKQAAVNMLDKLGIKPDFESGLERFVGTGNTLRTLFALAEKTGELGRVDGNDVQLALGTLIGEPAKKAAQAMLADPETAKKVETEGTPERARYDELVRNAAKKG